MEGKKQTSFFHSLWCHLNCLIFSLSVFLTFFSVSYIYLFFLIFSEKINASVSNHATMASCAPLYFPRALCTFSPQTLLPLQNTCISSVQITAFWRSWDILMSTVHLCVHRYTHAFIYHFRRSRFPDNSQKSR